MFKLKPAVFLKRDEVMLHLAVGGLGKRGWTDKFSIAWVFKEKLTSGEFL